MSSIRIALTFIALVFVSQLGWGQSSTTGFTNGTPKPVLNNPSNPNSGNVTGAVQTAVAWTNINGTRGVTVSVLQLVTRGNGTTTNDIWVALDPDSYSYSQSFTTNTPTGNTGNTTYSLTSGKTVMFKMQSVDGSGNNISDDVLSAEIIVP